MVRLVKRLIVLLVVSMCFSSSFFVNSIFAKENSDINMGKTLENYKDSSETMLKNEQEITTMDENGNVFPLEQTEAKMPEVVSDSGSNDFSRLVTQINNSSIAVVNFRTKSSSGSNTEYTEFLTGRAGYTNGYYAADGAFLGYDNEANPTKVKFMQAGVVGWVDVNEVEVLDYTSSIVNTLSKYYVKNGRIYHGISTNLKNSTYGSSLDYGPKPDYLKEGTDYYSYDGHYFYEGDTYSSYAKMLNDYRNNSRDNSVNSGSPYYNYYEYLSHRSVTTYTAEQLNNAITAMVGASESSYGRTSKLRNTASSFIENQNKYGTNALLMIAVAANESAWGCSSIAANKNNLFGHAAYDSDPGGSANGYSSVEYSIYYHSAQFISKGYLDPVTDGRYFGANVGDKASGINVKYASDPYWGEKAAAVCWKIDSYLGSKDAYRYTIGIKDTINTNHSIINIKSDANSSSNTLYSTYPKSKTTVLKDQAPSNYAFIILNNGDKNNYYKIQSDGAVNSNRTGIINTPSQPEYNFDKDYGYIPKTSVIIVSQGFDSNPTVTYQTHIESVGWQDWKNEGEVSGTSGQSKRLEAIKIELENNSSYSGGIQYQTHIESIGWQDWKSNGEVSGTSGQSKRLEAIKIRLTGEMAKHYDIYYRMHAQEFGWLGWAKNGEAAGTSGYSYRLEAIEIVLVEKGGKAPEGTQKAFMQQRGILYSTHVESVGWQSNKFDGETSGTSGQSKRLEAIKINLNSPAYSGGIEYSTHIENIGWQDKKRNGEMSGTSGQSKRLEAIKINLTGEMASYYDIYYRVHAQEFGWLGWAKNGEASGTEGYSYRLEAIEIVLVEKGGKAPGDTNNTFIKR